MSRIAVWTLASITAVVPGAIPAWAGSDASTFNYTVSERIDGCAFGTCSPTQFLAGPGLSPLSGSASGPESVAIPYACDASVFCYSKYYLSGSASASAYATLGLLRASANVSEAYSQDADYQGFMPGSGESGMSADASYDDLIFIKSKLRPDGTPYLKDGTLVHLIGLFYLQSFESVSNCSSGGAFDNLTAQIGGPEGQTATITHDGCDSQHVFFSSAVISYPAVVGSAEELKETLSSAANAYVSLSAPDTSASADAIHTGGVVLTVDSPYATYTSASGTIYPTTLPPGEGAQVPEPAGVLPTALGLALLGGIRLARRT